MDFNEEFLEQFRDFLGKKETAEEDSAAEEKPLSGLDLAKARLVQRLVIARDGDITILERELIETNRDVLSINDIKVTNNYAISAIKAKKFMQAEYALTKLPELNDKQREIIGLTAHEEERYASAAEKFSKVRELSKPSKMAYAISLAHIGDENISTFYTLLKDFGKDNPIANSLMGHVLFSRGSYDLSTELFTQVRDVSPNSEKSWLNLMKVEIAKGKEGNLQKYMAEFYQTTHSTIPIERLEQALSLPTCPPKVSTKNLYSIAKQLLKD